MCCLDLHALWSSSNIYCVTVSVYSEGDRHHANVLASRSEASASAAGLYRFLLLFFGVRNIISKCWPGLGNGFDKEAKETRDTKIGAILNMIWVQKMARSATQKGRLGLFFGPVFRPQTGPRKTHIYTTQQLNFTAKKSLKNALARWHPSLPPFLI